MKIHYAPWHRYFRTFYYRGMVAHEVQVGRTVVQWTYKPESWARFLGKRLHIWRDTF